MQAPKSQLDRDVLKAALTEFYSIHNASRLSSIDTIVESYAGKEMELLEELKKRYKVEFEPFNRIIADFRASNPSAAFSQVVDGTIDQNAASTVSSSPHQKREEPVQSTRASLAALGIPTLFTDKIMNGVNWKGFTIDSSALISSAADTRKEASEQVEEDTNKIDFALLAKETGHPEELLIRLERTLDLNASLEKNIRQSLRKFEYFNIPPCKILPQKSQPDFSPEFTVTKEADYEISLAGRTENSLKLELSALRELVDYFRDFILDSLMPPSLSSANQSPNPMAECSNESEGSATLEGDLHENEVEKETCESGGSSLIPSKLLSKLQEIKSDFTFNWRDHDELIVRVNELSKENQSLLEKLNSKDALIAARDENILMQQRENNQLREQLRQSYVSKDELIKIGNEKILYETLLLLLCFQLGGCFIFNFLDAGQWNCSSRTT
jgi:hypothetical protein